MTNKTDQKFNNIAPVKKKMPVLLCFSRVTEPELNQSFFEDYGEGLAAGGQSWNIR